MCGIAGNVYFDPAHPVDRERLVAMTDLLAHRGPDGQGVYVGPGIGLGHRRLSIIDLETGAQPLSNEDGTVRVVFNGEIYNFADIRSELERSHVFRTHSDTEVIVHAYEEWGERCVDRFQGMFAFALWDERRRRLVLVRDRVGVKPLYYSLTRSGISFGSEIKSILCDPDVGREWCPEALDAYLVLQYVPCPRTIYKQISSLPPGHMLIVENGRATLRQYWDLTFPGGGDPSREHAYLDELETRLRQAVQLRLISDVPLGAFLSGGIDSTLVVAAMAETAADRLVTISVGFDEQAFNELEHARTVSRHLASDAHETIVRSDVTELLPRLAWHFDEPFGDSSAVPTYYVSAAARQHVTVALSGDGGDELWAGYGRHRVEQCETIARRWLGPRGASFAGRLALHLPLEIKGARSMRHLALPPDEAYASKHAYELFEVDCRSTLYSGDFGVAVRDGDPLAGLRAAYAACPSADPLDRALYVDVKTYLADDILTKVDRMSMAVSLEAREPLLDHKLLEFAASVPSSLKIRRGQSKYLLRRFLKRRIPPSIVNRKKQGFSVPIGEWLRGPLAPMVDGLLSDGTLRQRGIFEDRAIQRMWHEHRDGVRDHRYRLWNLVMLELWFRTFIDRPVPSQALAGAAA